MKAVILAAGKGTRLLPLTNHTPKLLMQVARVPMADRIFQSLPDAIDEVIVVVEHLRANILAYVGNDFYGRPVRYVNQIAMRGTLGALFSAKPLIQPGERFLVLNGDDIHDRAELEACLAQDGRSFGVQMMRMPGYSSVHLDADNYVKGLYPQTEYEQANGAYTATGAYVVDTDIFNHKGVATRDGVEFGLPQTILAQKDTHPLRAVITDRWLTVNSFDDLERVEAEIGRSPGTS